MTGILGGESFTKKHMTQMGSALSALDFRPDPIRIREPFYRARQFLVETRPSAAGIELTGIGIQGSITLAAKIRALL